MQRLVDTSYVGAEDEEVSSDPERADLLTLPVLVREESVLPFFRLFHVCLNLEYSRGMQSLHSIATHCWLLHGMGGCYVLPGNSQLICMGDLFTGKSI